MALEEVLGEAGVVVGVIPILNAGISPGWQDGGWLRLMRISINKLSPIILIMHPLILLVIHKTIPIMMPMHTRRMNWTCSKDRQKY